MNIAYIQRVLVTGKYRGETVVVGWMADYPNIPVIRYGEPTDTCRMYLVERALANQSQLPLDRVVKLPPIKMSRAASLRYANEFEKMSWV